MEFNFLDWKRGEIWFVIAVLVIIFGVSFYQLKIGEMKTRDAQRKADVELVARALRRYYEDHGFYPAGSDGKIVACGDRGMGVCEWGEEGMVDEDNVVYLRSMPADPLSSRGWTYVYETDGKGFAMYVGLENQRDQVIESDLTRECGPGIQCKWYVEE